MQRITTFLTFKSKGKEAVEFYASVFKNSTIHHAMTHPGTGALLHASFSLDGQEYMAMDGGDTFGFSTGTSLFVTCEGQEEVDYFWDKLGEGGVPGRCGWLVDRYGLSWQIVPTALGQLMMDPDQEKSGRVMNAMLAMDRIVVADLEKAHGGE
jgi:predicted 3-demethylubiquinone-9 3-methyltransferase (glyoxalase superfamily)